MVCVPLHRDGEPVGVLEVTAARTRAFDPNAVRSLTLLGEFISVVIRTAFDITELQFAPHTRETFEAQLKSPRPAEVRRAEAMLKAYDERHPVRATPYPVQAIRFEKGPTILALGGEVLVDYDLRVKHEFAGPLIVAGYSNDVMCYIPSKRVLGEGGYEAVDSMIYYGQPGRWAPGLEDKIVGKARELAKAVE